MKDVSKSLVPKFMIVDEVHRHHCEARVNGLLNFGYQLHGDLHVIVDPTTGLTHYTQALVYYTKND